MNLNFKIGEMGKVETRYIVGLVIGIFLLIIGGVIYPITNAVTVVLLEDNIALKPWLTQYLVSTTYHLVNILLNKWSKPGTLFYVNWKNPKPEVLLYLYQRRSR